VLLSSLKSQSRLNQSRRQIARETIQCTLSPFRTCTFRSGHGRGAVECMKRSGDEIGGVRWSICELCGFGGVKVQ